MSNSFSSSPQLVDPSRLTASQTIRTTEVSKLGDLQNYLFANGGCGDVLNQAWEDGVFRSNSTTGTQHCEWYIPRPSNKHYVLKIRIAAHSSPTGNTVGIQLKFPISGGVYNGSTTITDSTRYASSFEEITVNITSYEDELFCLVRLNVTCISGYIEFASVEARWQPLTSPLGTGSQGQGSDSYIPQGISRLGADLPLSSRFGVEALSNITTLRKRGRTLLNWSGVNSAMNLGGSIPEEGMSAFNSEIMHSIVALYSGMNQIEDLDVDIFIKVQNWSSGDVFKVDVFGYQLTMSQDGWNSFGLSLRIDELERMSRDFRQSVYKVGLESTATNSQAFLSFDKNINDSPSPIYVAALAIIGV
jgi:hypothetical protein